MRFCLGSVLVAALLTRWAFGTDLPARENAAPPIIVFDRDVRPILAKHCFECHGPETHESGLRLDSQTNVLKGGKSGQPAVVPGKRSASRLFRVIAGRDRKLSMPPDGPRLAIREVETLGRWIDQGARWEAGNGAPSGSKQSESPPGADYWSFQPVRAASVPRCTRALPTGTANPQTVRDKSPLLGPANPIDAFIWANLRAVGLQPSATADPRSLVRRLYLDVLGLPPAPEVIARFSADAEADPLAWNRLVDRVLANPHYGERWARHWLDVVRFAETDGFETNVERPHAFHYRDYVIHALNEDEPYDRFIFEQIAGDAVGIDAATGFLVGGPCDQVKSPDVVLTRTQRQDELTDMVNTTGTAFLGLTLGCAKCHNHKFDPISQRDFYAIEAVFAGVKHGKRKPQRQQGATVYAGQFEEPGPVRRLFRGDPMSPRETVQPGAVAVLGSLKIAPAASEQQRRMALASWIARPENPLAARVIVNRLWQSHFGRGIVETPSDFGHNGGRPSHPELLDWLAREVVSSGWSLKHIHRLILTSSAYRQTSAPRDDGRRIDAASRLLWRFPPRRLEAEAIRDSMLAVSGALEERMGGPGFSLFEPNNNYVRVYLPKEQFGPAEWRRMVYMLKVRMEQDAVFGAFDCPDAGLIAPRRTQSTTALQALNLMNSRFTVQQAELMASRTERESGSATDRQIRRAFALAFGRSPDNVEQAAARRLVDAHGLPSLCRALFNANEFLFIP